MKASEINIAKDGFLFNTKDVAARSHYKFVMQLGRAFPTTIAQAKFFLSKGVCLDALNMEDVEKVESFLNKHGFEGDYIYTKSKRFVRLSNSVALRNALKKEFSI